MIETCGKTQIMLLDCSSHAFCSGAFRQIFVRKYVHVLFYMFYLKGSDKVYINPNFFGQLLHFKICEIVYSPHLNKEYS